MTLPMVIDADALNAFAGKTESACVRRRRVSDADTKEKRRVLVLTPHPGEMARLLGVTVKDVEADRLQAWRGNSRWSMA